MTRPSRLVAIGSLLGLAFTGCEHPTDSPQVPIQADVASMDGPQLTFFSDRAAFQMQVPNLPLEDFEEGVVPDGRIVTCPGPLDATSDNACFSPGDIEPGVQFNSDNPRSGAELALAGPGFLGNPSKNIVVNFFADAFIIDFTGGNVTATGMDLVAYIAGADCQVDIFGANGLLGSTQALCTPQGTFWGVSSDEVITRIRIFAPDRVEGVDNISFGVGVVPPNVAPAVGEIAAPLAPVQVNTVVTASANFTDPDVLDTHTGVFDWGDGTSSDALVIEANGSGSASGTHTYTAAGVYTVSLTVTDNDGAAGQSVFQFVVVFDPSTGFVTGGGWIASPAGAYTANPSLTGKATFGFVAAYRDGARVPSGNTEFQFHAAEFNFHSTSYDWLVVSGPKAQYKGSGTVNGAGDYGFRLTAVDGQVTGGGGADKLRIQVWDKATGQTVYDTQLGAGEGTNPTTALGGGAIVIQK